VPRFAQRRVILFFWPMRASSWNQSSSGLPLLAAIVARMSGTFFKGLDGRLVVLVMAWPRREFSIPERAQFVAQDLFGDRDAILVEHPLRQIDQPPAYNPMDRRDRTGLDHGDERTPLVVVELRGAPGRLAVDEPIWPPEIKPQDPIANGLQPHAPEPSRVHARAAVIDRHKRKQTPGDAPGLFSQNQGPKHRPIEIAA
jgi:hypothetical protein